MICLNGLKTQGAYKWYGLQAAGRVPFGGLVFGDHPHVHHGLIICVPHLCSGQEKCSLFPILGFKRSGLTLKISFCTTTPTFPVLSLPPQSLKLLL